MLIFLYECYSDIDFWGEYNHPAYEQTSKWLLTKEDNYTDSKKVIEFKTFIVQKKDGTRIAVMFHFFNQHTVRCKSVTSWFQVKGVKDTEWKRLS
jgi:hypothetical protein